MTGSNGFATTLKALLLSGAALATPAFAQVAPSGTSAASPPGSAPFQAAAGSTGSQQDAVAATAGSPPADQAAGDAEIIVTGIRRSLEDALQTKRQSIQVLDSISAEGIGKLPDQNLAESLQRLPGVQINRSAQRRLGTVSIRGLPGDFSQTLINGQYLASPDVSNFSFGTVRSEVFSGIDVVKANSAADFTGGLSGLINLRTGNPLQAKNQLSVTVNGKFEELTEKVAPGGAVVFSRQLIPGVLGVRAAFGYQKLRFREDNAQINTYDKVGGAQPAGTPEITSDDIWSPKQIRFATNDTKGDGYSGAITAEWKPTDSLHATVWGFYNDFKPRSYTSQFTVDTITGTTAAPRSTRVVLATTNDGDLGQTQNRIRINNPTLIVDSRILDDRYKTYAATGNVQWEKEGWLIDATAHYTKGTRSRANFGYQAQQQAATGTATVPGNNGLVAEIDTGAGSIGKVFYDLTGNPRLNLAQAFGSPLAPTYRQINATANATQNFIGGFRNENESEDELAFELNLRRDLDLGPLKSVEAGGVYRQKKQGQRNTLQSLFGANLTGLSSDLYNFSFLNGTGKFMDGKLGMFDPADYAELDVDRITALIRPTGTPANLPANAIIGPGGLVAIADTTSIAQIYDNKQKIYGGYAQLNLDQEFGADFHLRGNAGVRYEKSERSTVARNAANQPTAPLKFTYDNWLPSVNLVLEGWRNWVLRGSYNKTLRRPQVDSFAVLRSVAVDGTGQLVTVNLGAGDLKPFTSKNLDLSLEWYNRAGSSISALVFRKKVEDYAGSTRVCPADGGGFGFGTLTTASGGCRTTTATPASGLFPAVAANAVVNINVTANQDTFILKGFELAAQQNLSFLPGLLSGFGVQANYTYIDFKNSSSTFRLSEISKNTYNVILYYETPLFSIRGAYVHRSGYFLGSAGTATGADRFVRSRPQLDLTANLNISDRLSVNAEVFNVTNEELYEYEGSENRARNYTVYGRTVQAGVTYRF